MSAATTNPSRTRGSRRSTTPPEPGKTIDQQIADLQTQINQIRDAGVADPRLRQQVEDIAANVNLLEKRLSDDNGSLSVITTDVLTDTVNDLRLEIGTIRDSIGRRVESLEQTVGDHDVTITQHEERMQLLEGIASELNGRNSDHEERIGKLEKSNQVNWLTLALLVLLIGGLVYLVLLVFTDLSQNQRTAWSLGIGIIGAVIASSFVGNDKKPNDDQPAGDQPKPSLKQRFNTWRAERKARKSQSTDAHTAS